MAGNRAQDDDEFDEKTHRMSIRIVKTQYGKLKRIADHEGRTVSDMIRQLIGQFLRDSNNFFEGDK